MPILRMSNSERESISHILEIDKNAIIVYNRIVTYILCNEKSAKYIAVKLGKSHDVNREDKGKVLTALQYMMVCGGDGLDQVEQTKAMIDYLLLNY